LLHNPAAIPKNDYSATVIDDSVEPNFSDLLYNIIYSQNIDITELKTFFSKAIENQNEKKVTEGESAKAVTPGSPIIELAASEQGKKWIDLTEALEKDGLPKSFSGIVINGRVSAEVYN
jgi:hypothetical protein